MHKSSKPNQPSAILSPIDRIRDRCSNIRVNLKRSITFDKIARYVKQGEGVEMKIRESETRLRVQVKFRGSIDLRNGTSTRNSKVDMNISRDESRYPPAEDEE